MRDLVNNKLFAALLLGASLLFTSIAQSGEFSSQIESAELRRQDDWYVLDSSLKILLSKTSKEALLSNIALTWNLKIQLKQTRPIYDKVLLDSRYRYKIRYHSLFNTYSLINETTNTEKKYTSLVEALDELAQISELPIIQASALTPHKLYKIAIKLELDKESLPPHLRPVAYLDSEWDLSSDWYVWSLKN